MKINGIQHRSIWLNEDGFSVDIIDQTVLPHEFEIRTLGNLAEAAEAYRMFEARKDGVRKILLRPEA